MQIKLYVCNLAMDWFQKEYEIRSEQILLKIQKCWIKIGLGQFSNTDNSKLTNTI